MSNTHKVTLAVDADAHMLSLHHHNFPECKHICAKLGVTDSYQYAAKFGQALLKFMDGKPWHLHGSPPCQSFSIAHRRGGHQTGGDERTNLTFWFLDLVDWLRSEENAPISWSMEQVPTALKLIREQKPWIDTVTCVTAFGWQFGAPTLRKRLFLGEGWELNPVFRNAKKRNVDGVPTSLPPPTPSHPELGIPHVLTTFRLPATHVAVRGTRNYDYTGYNHSFIGPLNKNKQRNHRVDSAKGEGLRDFTKPCYAMVASQGLAIWTHDGPEVDGEIEWRKRRMLTHDEAKTIQGFPSWYEIQHVVRTELVAYESVFGAALPVVARPISNTHKIRAIGNSVCPRISGAMFGCLAN